MCTCYSQQEVNVLTTEYFLLVLLWSYIQVVVNTQWSWRSMRVCSRVYDANQLTLLLAFKGGEWHFDRGRGCRLYERDLIRGEHRIIGFNECVWLFKRLMH